MRHNSLTVLLLIALTTALTTTPFADDNPFPKLTGPYLGQEPPGDLPVTFADGILNPPDGYHCSIVFSPDGTEAFWTGMSKNTYYSRQQDGVWTEPVITDIDKQNGIGEPFFSPDGRRLYFLSRRLPYEGAGSRERIWFVEREQDEWSEPRLIDSVVARHPTHWQFSLSSNGNLYFTSEIEGVAGHQDIFMAVWDGERFLDPVRLSDAINSDVRDLCPFIAPDESYLIFSRTVPGKRNRTDLFISFRGSDGDWLDAVNMGDTINTLHNDICAVVTPDGRYMLFGRISGDINKLWWVSADLIDRLRK